MKTTRKLIEEIHQAVCPATLYSGSFVQCLANRICGNKRPFHYRPTGAVQDAVIWRCDSVMPCSDKKLWRRVKIIIKEN